MFSAVKEEDSIICLLNLVFIRLCEARTAESFRRTVPLKMLSSYINNVSRAKLHAKFSLEVAFFFKRLSRVGGCPIM